jgi:branched-chain amino acid transport system ATP-binding protein
VSTLSVDDARVHFDGLKAVDGVSLEVEPGRVVGLIGPNGAGKTTLFNAISGHVRLTDGTVRFLGRDVTGAPPHKRAHMGLARTFQLGGLIDELTALENVVLGLDQRARIGDGQVPRANLRAKALSLLDKLGISAIGDELVEALPMGLRRQVEVIRAVASDPHLVLLDEPGAGLTGAERLHLSAMIRGLTSERLSFVITDHSTDLVFSVSDEVLVMNFGRPVMHGPPDEVRRHPEVMEAYLGTSHE